MIDKKRVSIIDIAEMANVSIATVSRVLNQKGRYSTETQKKIEDLVKEYEYVPNAIAKSLRTNKTQTIGVIVPDITNEFFAKIVRSIENNIIKYGYTVFVCDSHENEELENIHIENLMNKNIDGVIYISGKGDVAGIEKKHRIPVVYIDRQPENAPAIIQSDNRLGGYIATEELIKKGCRNIIILQDYRHLSTIKHRYEGYLEAHKRYGLVVDDKLIFDNTPGYKNAREAIENTIKNGLINFDGIFATNDIMALGALHALLDKGISVPEKVKIVGFDDISISAFCQIPITTVTQDTGLIGLKSVEVLMNQIKNREVSKSNIILPVKLNVRESTEAK